jgi:hypothetical protein
MKIHIVKQQKQEQKYKQLQEQEQQHWATTTNLVKKDLIALSTTTCTFHVVDDKAWDNILLNLIPSDSRIR